MIDEGRVERRSLTWAMHDVASPHLTPEERTWLCVQIGAGDVERALITIVGICARNGSPVPSAMREPLRNWLRGYAGTKVAEEFESYVGGERETQTGSCAPLTSAPAHPKADRYSNRPHRVDRGSPIGRRS